MSELMENRSRRLVVRWDLLASASAIVLANYTCCVTAANAGDADRLTFWIELDGQYSFREESASYFAPPFVSTSPFDGNSHFGLEDGPGTEWEKGGSITLRPSRADWFLKIAARYGKSSRVGTRDSHPTAANLTKYSGNHYTAYQNFSAHSSASHVVADFQVGRDVGIGRFGSDGNSVLSGGIRIAQFRSRSHIAIKSQPTNTNAYNPYNKFYASLDAARKFNGIGPSLSWNASATLIGDRSEASIAFDWGVNAAILFGRQKSDVSHQTTKNHFNYFHATQAYQTDSNSQRSKSVVVPNLGAFAGLSWRYPAAKLAFGYRADFFFGAMDTGIDVRKSSMVGFHGPFATISLGLGG